MEDKICPLLSIPRKEALFQKKKVLCKKDKCAWYLKRESPDVEGCAIRELSYVLKDIHLKM